MTSPREPHPFDYWMKWIGYFAGPLLALLTYFLLPAPVLDATGTLVSGLTPGGRATTAIGALMVVWWITEAIPLAATALLPLVLFPASGALKMTEAASPFANEVIFLFLGGFILGLAMEKWGLHKRVALATVLLVGTGPKRLIGGFMVATAAISLWVSNTSTTIMMLPIAMSVIALVAARHAPPGTPADKIKSPDPNFDSALLLGVAYASSIGGVGTLIGTPPMTVLKGFVETQLHRQLGFGNWMMLGLPLVIVFLFAAWLFLTSVSVPVRLKEIPGGRAMIRDELRALGRMGRGEIIVLAVFAFTVALWIGRPILADWGTAHGFGAFAGLNDSSIAVLGAMALFLIPVRPREGVFAMDWHTAERLPWGVLILFGGGLSLAAAITANGVDVYIGRFFGGLGHLPMWVIVLAVVTVVIFLSELASNTAVTTTVLPILTAAAPTLGVDPMRLIVPATIAASLSFMLPVGTPPNAIVFGTGRVPSRQMIRAGFGLDIIGIILITLLCLLVGNGVESLTR